MIQQFGHVLDQENQTSQHFASGTKGGPKGSGK